MDTTDLPKDLARRALEFRGVHTTTTGGDVDAAGPAAEAVISWINSLPSVRRLEDGTWAPDTAYAAVLATARLIGRRNSTTGVESYGMDGVSYVARADPDVERLLRIGRYAPPMVG